MSVHKRKLDSDFIKSLTCQIKSPITSISTPQSRRQSQLPKMGKDEFSKSINCQKDIDKQYQVSANDKFQKSLLQDIKKTHKKLDSIKLAQLSNVNRQGIFTPEQRSSKEHETQLYTPDILGEQPAQVKQRLISTSLDFRKKKIVTPFSKTFKNVIKYNNQPLNDINKSEIQRRPLFSRNELDQVRCATDLRQQALISKKNNNQKKSSRPESTQSFSIEDSIDFFSKSNQEEILKNQFQTMQNSPRLMSPMQQQTQTMSGCDSASKLDFNMIKGRITSLQSSMESNSQQPLANKAIPFQNFKFDYLKTKKQLKQQSLISAKNQQPLPSKVNEKKIQVGQALPEDNKLNDNIQKALLHDQKNSKAHLMRQNFSPLQKNNSCLKKNKVKMASKLIQQSSLFETETEYEQQNRNFMALTAQSLNIANFKDLIGQESKLSKISSPHYKQSSSRKKSQEGSINDFYIKNASNFENLRNPKFYEKSLQKRLEIKLPHQSNIVMQPSSHQSSFDQSPSLNIHKFAFASVDSRQETLNNKKDKQFHSSKRPLYLKYSNLQPTIGLNASKFFVSDESLIQTSTYETRLKTLEKVSKSIDVSKATHQGQEIMMTQLSGKNGQRIIQKMKHMSKHSPRIQQTLKSLDLRALQKADQQEQDYQVPTQVIDQSMTLNTFRSNDSKNSVSLEKDIEQVNFNIQNQLLQGSRDSRNTSQEKLRSLPVSKVVSEERSRESDLSSLIKVELTKRDKMDGYYKKNEQLFEDVRRNLEHDQDAKMREMLRNYKLQMKISTKDKINSLLGEILLENTSKKIKDYKEQHEIIELFEFMDRRKEKIVSGSTVFTQSEMKQLLKHLDFLTKMSYEKREKYRERLKDLLQQFKQSTTGIENDIKEQIKMLHQYVEEINQSLGKIAIQKSVVKEKEYNEKNSVILDMLKFNKRDQEFANQLEEANAGTRHLINHLIKSLEDDEENQNQRIKQAQRDLALKRQQTSIMRNTFVAMPNGRNPGQKDLLADETPGTTNIQTPHDIDARFLMKDSPSKVQLQIVDNQNAQINQRNDITAGLKTKFSIAINAQQNIQKNRHDLMTGKFMLGADNLNEAAEGRLFKGNLIQPKSGAIDFIGQQRPKIDMGQVALDNIDYEEYDEEENDQSNGGSEYGCEQNNGNSRPQYKIQRQNATRTLNQNYRFGEQSDYNSEETQTEQQTITEKSEEEGSDTSSFTSFSKAQHGNGPSRRASNATDLNGLTQKGISDLLTSPASRRKSRILSKQETFVHTPQSRLLAMAQSGISSEGLKRRMSFGIAHENKTPDSKQGEVQGFSLIRKNVRKFGPACQKFREIVQKHFLTKSLKQLEEMDDNDVSINMLLLLGELKSALNEILPEASTHTIGERYEYLDKNLYANDFLQGILSDVPGFGQNLNYKQLKMKKKEEDAELQAEIEKEQQEMAFIDEQKIYSEESYDSEAEYVPPSPDKKSTLGSKSNISTHKSHKSRTQKSRKSSRSGTKNNTGTNNSDDDSQPMNYQTIMEKRRKLAKMKRKNTRDNLSLNKLFQQQTEKTQFYNLAKKKHLKQKEEEDIAYRAMKNYFAKCSEQNIKVQPFFIQFEDNTLFLSQERINYAQGKAMKEYMQIVRSLKEKRIYRLVIDQCGMHDEVFAQILEGCLKQCKVYQSSGLPEIQYLTTLVYTGNKFGSQSLAVLTKLLPNLIDLTIGAIPETGGMNRETLGQLVHNIALHGSKLMKLKISNIFMNYNQVVESLCQILDKSRVIQSIDFSWASLSAVALAKISQAFMARLKSLRTIDLSYNQANILQKHEKASKHGNFVDNLCEFLSEAEVVNHLKLSGMGLKREQVIKISEHVVKCPLMLSIHLNDNDINTDNNFLLEVLNVYALGEEDLLDVHRSIKNQRLIKPPNQNAENDPIQSQFNIDYKTVMKVYMGFQPQRFVDKIKFEQDEAINVQRKIYKDHILLGKNQKIVDNLKAINTSQVSQGLGRLDDNEIDQFVITRIVNYPELIFNQRIKNDFFKQNQFFQKDAGMKWQLEKGSECYVCSKHRYTIIFYEKGILSNNPGLVEVQDQAFLQQLKVDFQRNYIKYKSMTPIICGTVINKLRGAPQFHRKLKMIRASLFTLMCISGSRIFISERYQTHKLKNGTLRYLDFDNIDVLEGLNIKEKLDGWQAVLDDKCNYNELTDVTKVNCPNFEEDLHKRDIYIFAGFLKPGYHQILIYDPEQDRAFVKDFIVGINHKDFYPEFPLLHGAKQIKTVQNVWRSWIEDSEEDCLNSFNKDTQCEEFEVHKFIKNPDDAKKCMDLLLENFDMVKVYQKELLVGSSKYPQIDFDRLVQFINWIHENTSISKKIRLQRAQLELAFIRATRFDETSGLNSAMQRMELYEFILRIAQSWSYAAYSAREFVSDHILEFFQLYIKPISDNSQATLTRKAIRQSAKLNELLYDNLKGLEIIFEEGKLGAKTFTQDSAVNLFLKYPEFAKHLTVQKIQECFIFSQMTVLNEQIGLQKYGYIEFVEFLDLLCRIALIIAQIQDTIENKVYDLISTIYNYRYQNGTWNQEDMPLHQINDEVEC